jgi:carboxymethylenebutenolidase
MGEKPSFSVNGLSLNEFFWRNSVIAQIFSKKLGFCLPVATQVIYDFLGPFSAIIGYICSLQTRWWGEEPVGLMPPPTDPLNGCIAPVLTIWRCEMNIFQKYLVDEFAEDYEEGRLSRREALKMIAAVSGSLLVANSILAACTPPPEASPTAALLVSPTQAAALSSPSAGPTQTPTAEAKAEPTQTQPVEATAHPTQGPSAQPHGTVSPDDPAVSAGDLQFEGEGATLLGYLARPAQAGLHPLVLVCHENRGLTEHIKDVARRLAKAGYAALAVDLLSRQGGSNAMDSSQVPGALGNIDPDQFAQDFRSGLRYLQAQSFAQAERVGMVGFCFGGGVTWLAATRISELKAAVPFYGPHPPLEDVKDIQAAVLAIYGERDQRINQGIPEIEAAMQQNDKVFEKIIYPDADHAFFNDTGPRYNPQAAQDAWQRLLDWFGRYLA